MNASMLLMTAWIAGADVVPACCASCAAPAPAPAPVATPAETCDTCGSAVEVKAKHAKLGLFSKLFASGGGHHKKKKGEAECDTCGTPAPACDSCGSAPAAAPAPAAPPVAAPAEAPKEMPKPTAPPQKVSVPLPADESKAPKADGIVIPSIVTPVSGNPKTTTLGTPANPF